MSPESQQPVSGQPVASSAPADDVLSPNTADGANSGAVDDATGNAADAAQGTPEQQAAHWRAQAQKEALDAKIAREELNRLRREGANTPSHSTVTPPTDPGTAQIAELEQLLGAAREEYRVYGNAGTALSIRNFELSLRQAQENWLGQQLLKVPEKHRDQVERGIRERRYADADSALDAIVGREARGELESLRKEVDRLKGAEAQRAEGVVGTGRGIPVTASQARFIPKTLAELNAEQARLEQVDPDARAELSRRHRNGDFGILPLQ